ncbi:PAP_central domain-containing protein, partial [Meloidogyne graminicola]
WRFLYNSQKWENFSDIWLKRKTFVNYSIITYKISFLHLTLFSIIFAKNACIDIKNNKILINRKYFLNYFGEKFLEENGKIKIEFFENIKPLIDKNNNTNKFFKSLDINLKRTIIMLNQQYIDNTIRNEIFKLNEENKLFTKILNKKWVNNPNLYEINQFYIENDENKFNKNNKNIEEDITEIEFKKYLDKIYFLDNETITKRKEAVEWIENQVKIWLQKQCNFVGIKYENYSIIVGGSSLLETATKSSDLDIIFLLPNHCLIPNIVKECEECKINFSYGRFCSKHDFLFGENEGTFNYKMKILQSSTDDLTVNAIPFGRVPLFEIKYKDVDIDIMFAINGKKIDLIGDLTDYSNKQIILNNLIKIDKIIDDMIKTEEKYLLARSVIILAGYRIAYRLKYFIIDDERRQTFTYLLRSVKLWAKNKEIYSNMDWPMPLIVEPLNTKQIDSINLLKSWQITDIDPENENYGDQMPIISPLFPEQNTAYNINLFTKTLIIKNMNEAYNYLENEENYLKFFEQFNYLKYYKYFILIACLTTINNYNCISVKPKLRKNFEKWANTSIIKSQLKQYQIISSFQREEENCLIDRINGSCTFWIVGIELINNETIIKFKKDSIEMLNYYMRWLTKESIHVKLFFMNQYEIENKIKSFIHKRESNLFINNIIPIKKSTENENQSKLYFGPSQNTHKNINIFQRKENPLNHNKLIPPNNCENELFINAVFLPEIKDLKKEPIIINKNKKEKFSNTKNNKRRKGKSKD